MNRLTTAAALGMTAAACAAPTPSAEVSGPAPTTAPEPPTTTVTIRSEVVPQSAATFTLPEDEAAERTDEEWWADQPGYRDDRALLLACIRSYEQGADGYATDTGNGYYGAYQFDQATWESVGGTGNPAHALPAEQDARASELIDRRGLAPWPTPSRRCR